MAKAKFDIKTIQTTVQTEAQRGLHAYVGAADLALEAVKEYVAEAQKLIEAYQKDAQKQFVKAQKSVKAFDLQPKTLRSQATTVVSARVEELSKDAKARRDAVEKRVAELQAEAQKFVTGNVENATDTYDELVKRGETLVRKFRKQPVAKKVASTTAPATKSTAKKAPAKKTAKKAPAKKTAKTVS